MYSRLGQFAVASPETLQRDLQRLERGVADELDRLDAKSRWGSIARVRANYTAQMGQLLIVDSSQGDISILLPRPRRNDAGRELGIIRTTASNAVTVEIEGGSASSDPPTINGASSYTTTTAVGYVATVVADGLEYWA